jgi:hypothetical protein
MQRDRRKIAEEHIEFDAVAASLERPEPGE